MVAADYSQVQGPARRNNWSDADVEKHWDAVAPIYEAENARVVKAHDQRFTVAIPRLELRPGMRVLNISSRDAGAEIPMQQACLGVSVVHAEISAGLIAVARARHPSTVQVKLSSYAALPFEDSAFDRVLSLETLEHVSDPPAFLSELHRVCAPEGLLVLSCPPATAEIPYRIFAALFGGHGEGPHRFLPSREVCQLLAASGWELQWRRGTLLLPVGPRWLSRSAERLLGRFPRGLLAEFGIRQFYVARRV